MDGVSIDFDLGFDSDAILDAAIKQGADLPCLQEVFAAPAARNW